MRTTRFVGEVLPTCPTCGKMLDGATDIIGDATPSAGDFTVCVGCRDILVFTDELGLRALTEEDMKDLPVETVMLFENVLGMVKQ
jgi:hypothetical protein